MKLDQSSKEDSNDKENDTHVQLTEEPKDDRPNVAAVHIPASSSPQDEASQEDTSDEGWQEAVPKGRFLSNCRLSGSKRPSRAKHNTNVLINSSENSRTRSAPEQDLLPASRPQELP